MYAEKTKQVERRTTNSCRGDGVGQSHTLLLVVTAPPLPTTGKGFCEEDAVPPLRECALLERRSMVLYSTTYSYCTIQSVLIAISHDDDNDERRHKAQQLMGAVFVFTMKK